LRGAGVYPRDNVPRGTLSLQHPDLAEVRHRGRGGTSPTRQGRKAKGQKPRPKNQTPPVSGRRFDPRQLYLSGVRHLRRANLRSNRHASHPSCHAIHQSCAKMRRSVRRSLPRSHSSVPGRSHDGRSWTRCPIHHGRSRSKPTHSEPAARGQSDAVHCSCRRGSNRATSTTASHPKNSPH